MMTTRKFPFPAGATILALTLAFAATAQLRAQFANPTPPPAAAPETFDYELGTQRVNGAVYSVKATQPIDSKLKSQRVRFTSKSSTVSGLTTRFFTINTGKYKTVAQLNLYLREVFGKFIAGAPANTEVGKIGDVKFGGEVRFVVESPDVLLYNTMTPGETNASMTLPKEEVAAYAAILSGGTAVAK